MIATGAFNNIQRTPLNPFVGVASSSYVRPSVAHGRDQVSFGSTAEVFKKQSIEKQALALFKGVDSFDDIVAGMKAQYGDVFSVYDASKPGQEWVQRVCREIPAQAFIHIPDSVKYTHDKNTGAGFERDSRFPDKFTVDVLPELYRQKRPALFLSRSVGRGERLHELFHMIQQVNGKPCSVPYADVDGEAIDWNNNYNRWFLSGVSNDLAHWGDKNGFMAKCLVAPATFVLDQLGGMGDMAKRLFSWTVSVPLIGIQRALGLIKRNPNSAGESLRLQMKGEQQVDKFIMKHASELGLSWLDRLKALQHYLFESKLKELLSYKLEHITPKP